MALVDGKITGNNDAKDEVIPPKIISVEKYN